jgi:hypothetical protein
MDRQLIAEAIMGKDAEEFLHSDLGKYLIGCAEQEAQDAMNELARVYPWRRKRIQTLQNQIWRAQSIQSWLAELIIRGNQAKQALEE